MKNVFVTSLLIAIVSFTFSQKKTAYVIYNAKGKKVSYAKMIRTIAKKNDVVLFGEFHNNPISHWLQLEVTKDLAEKRELILGAEMFEADNQKQLDDYLNGRIDAKELDTTARLWKNFKTDYKPLVDFAKDNKLKFIACNVPRRYAKIVYNDGLEALEELPNNEKAWLAPLPIAYDSELPGYQAMLEMMGGHGGENLPKAQAIKDATMGYFIMKNRIPGQLFIHYNGAYHSDNYEAISWYLNKINPEVQVQTISTVSQDDVFKLLEENKMKADFIICVDEDMTTTY
ncbi:MAG: putative iron-regulated protein [Planctomycetota bacterium]|jgi:uncharacterized iron-regulated protein